ncbi:MAG: hypothetical protein HYS32_04305 [Candidatus Woesearchaeota archaeon]|nr:MAG: hypothetical protein HYS32_04305 [Candidatus Woesearchaeota archaeon]
MKHTLKITLILVLLFITAQVIGLFIINKYIVKELPYGIEKPEYDEKTSFVPVTILIIIGTIIALFLIRLRANLLWKLWFLFAITIALSISFSVFMPQIIALIASIILSVVRVFKPNVILHNFTELFIYGGIMSLFVPIFSIFSALILLILISLYDMYAVWKSKHMIKLAKYQTKMKIFAGLLIPYQKEKIAVLGGGDIAFPLLFAGAVLKTSGFFDAFLVIVYSAIALFLLFIYTKKGKFYPAMPFLTLGCIAGLLVGLI